MQRVLDLQFPSDSRAVERKIGVDGTDYLLRLLEFNIDDVDIDDDGTVDWPESIEDKLLPQIDGVVTLYDVTDRRSLEDVVAILRECQRDARSELRLQAPCLRSWNLSSNESQQLISFVRSGAIERVEIPSLLAATKCDAPVSEREIDPRAVERQARREIVGIETLQLTSDSADCYRQCVSILLRDIAVGKPGRLSLERENAC